MFCKSLNKNWIADTCHLLGWGYLSLSDVVAVEPQNLEVYK